MEKEMKFEEVEDFEKELLPDNNKKTTFICIKECDNMKIQLAVMIAEESETQ